VSLFGRIVWTGVGLGGVVVLLAVFVWKPAAQRSFVEHTEGLLADAEAHAQTITTSLVDETMEFSRESAVSALEQRTLAIQDLPLSLFEDERGRVDEARLKEAVARAIAAPGATGGEKFRAVRDEILARTRAQVQARLARLRAARQEEAAHHAARESWRTLGAWGGMILVLLAAWALVLDRVVVRPVRELRAAVGRFGVGERGVRADPSGAREVRGLAGAFNETAAAVEATERENAELRAGLEQKVRERTAALVRAARSSTAGTMAGGVAHEFNNLLSGILGCADAALEEEPRPEVREIVEMIRKTAGRGVGVTDALLRATRAEPEVGTCDAAALFDEALAEVRPPGGVRVVREERDTALRADAAMLRQTLANLIRNAVDAMGGEGTLTLRAGAGRIEVEDDGPGIPAAVREILFEPFVTTRAGGREGAGLGLFLAERLVAAHGGTLEVDSEEGRGTRFTIALPA